MPEPSRSPARLGNLRALPSRVSARLVAKPGSRSDEADDDDDDDETDDDETDDDEDSEDVGDSPTNSSPSE